MNRIDIIPMGGIMAVAVLATATAWSQPARPSVAPSNPAPAAGAAGAAGAAAKPPPAEFYDGIDDHFALNLGFTLLNPYKATTITDTNRTRKSLDSTGDTKSKFFIDAAINYVWAWDSDRRASFWKANHCGDDGVFDATKIGLGRPDIQAHISFYAKDSEEKAAAAIVGSGNFGGEVTLGLPLFRTMFVSPKTAGDKVTGLSERDLYNITRSVHWVGLVGSYSGITDSDAFDIHDRLLGGLGYRAAFRTKLENRDVVWNTTAGIASVDTVQFLNDGTKEIKLHHDDVPVYKKQSAFALESEAYIPVNKSLSVVIGTRLYSGLEPSTWNAYVGITAPFDKLVKGLTSFISDDAKTEGKN